MANPAVGSDAADVALLKRVVFWELADEFVERCGNRPVRGVGI